MFIKNIFLHIQRNLQRPLLLLVSNGKAQFPGMVIVFIQHPITLQSKMLFLVHNTNGPIKHVD